jgi:hypothetical protein
MCHHAKSTKARLDKSDQERSVQEPDSVDSNPEVPLSSFEMVMSGEGVIVTRLSELSSCARIDNVPCYANPVPIGGSRGPLGLFSGKCCSVPKKLNLA